MLILHFQNSVVLHEVELLQKTSKLEMNSPAYSNTQLTINEKPPNTGLFFCFLFIIFLVPLNEATNKSRIGVPLGTN